MEGDRDSVEDSDGEGDWDGNGEVLDVEMGRWRKLNESR